MRVFVTGGTGFVGSALVRALRGRGDDVVALVHTPSRADHLRHLGCELVEGDIEDRDAIRRGLEGADAAFHVAGVYRIGVTRSQAAEMERVNVGGTRVVLGLAREAGTPRVVHISTANVFGDTKGQVVDEGHRRPEGDFVSEYDRTKFLAHEVALEHGVLIAMPTGVYGPGDTSKLGEQVSLAMRGKLPYISFPTLGTTFAHVDDVAEGLLLVHDRGAPGEAYVLGGEVTTMEALIATAARVAGRKPPRLTMPTAMIRLMGPLGPLLKPLGLPPNMREVVAASHGVTYWASDAKARARLGYTSRTLEEGLLDWYATEHASHETVRLPL